MRKLLLILASLISVIALTSCEANGTKGAETANSGARTVAEETATAAPTEDTRIEKSIDAVAKYLGLDGGSETYYSMIGATAGKEYNNGSIELYQFDEDSDSYKRIIGENSPYNIGAYKDGIVILVPTGQKSDVELITHFNEIQFK